MTCQFFLCVQVADGRAEAVDVYMYYWDSRDGCLGSTVSFLQKGYGFLPLWTNIKSSYLFWNGVSLWSSLLQYLKLPARPSFEGWWFGNKLGGTQADHPKVCCNSLTCNFFFHLLLLLTAT